MTLSQNIELSKFANDTATAQHWMSSICGLHTLDTSQKALDFQYDGIRLPTLNTTIGMIEYGANVSIDVANLKSYSLSLPISGSQTLTGRGLSTSSSNEQALIVSSTEYQELILEKECKKIQVVIPEHSMRTVLSDILDTKIEDAIIFDFQMDIKTSPKSMVWWDNILHLFKIRKHYQEFYSSPRLSSDFENIIIKSLLLTQEHNYSDHIRHTEQKDIPVYIKRVHQFIIEHYFEQVTVKDLERISGVSKSKLYDEFYYFYGASPILYLKKYRLNQVHKALLNTTAHKHISISKLAYDAGFNHLSRFSNDYREAFGELPRETLYKKMVI